MPEELARGAGQRSWPEELARGAGQRSWLGRERNPEPLNG